LILHQPHTFLAVIFKYKAVYLSMIGSGTKEEQDEIGGSVVICDRYDLLAWLWLAMHIACSSN
jgi:hypothetical protein